MKPQANPEKRFILAVRECWLNVGRIPDDNGEPAKAAVTSRPRDSINKVLGSLSPREEKVLRMRFGLETGVAYTLKEIGEQLGCLPERIRQIESKALRKLCHPSRREFILRIAEDEMATTSIL